MRKLIDFKPAQLHSGPDNYIYYSVKFEGDAAFNFRRKRINNIARKERKRYADKCIREINDALFAYIDPGEIKITPGGLLIAQVIDKAYAIAENKKLRPDTLKDYRSHYGILKLWIAKNTTIKCVHEFSDKEAIRFFDDLLTTGVGAYTYNTYIIQYRSLWNQFVKRGYVTINPFKVIERLQTEEKERIILTGDQIITLRNFFIKEAPHYWVVCCLCLYCFVRRTEITRLKIGHIKFDKQTIELPGTAAKNHKSRSMVIPDEFFKVLIKLKYNEYPENYFMVSDNFKPGAEKLHPKKITDFFRVNAKKLNFDIQRIKFYSLKDTGISAMSDKIGGLKAAQIQAGHSNIQQTNTYYHLTPEAVENLKNIKY